MVFKFAKPIKIDGKPIDEIREGVKLPPIHTSEDAIYVMTVKKDKVNFFVEDYVPVFKNIKAYEDKWDEVKEGSLEKKYLTDQMIWHDSCLEDINCELHTGTKFYTSSDGKERDIFFFKLTDLNIRFHTDYFGEIDSEFDYKLEKVNREDIPEEIMKQFEENYDFNYEDDQERE